MKTTSATFLFVVLLCTACGEEPKEEEKDTFAKQVSRGQTLYGENCAGCHGADGTGTADAPAVVGEGALPLDPPASRQVRDVQFQTAADVFGWVRVNMPGGAPGSLTDKQYVEILAFALYANGVELEEPLSTSNAADIALH